MMDKTGSAKRGIISPDLLEERSKCAFNKEEMQNFLVGGQERERGYRELFDLMGNNPELRNHLEFQDMTPHEM